MIPEHSRGSDIDMIDVNEQSVQELNTNLPAMTMTVNDVIDEFQSCKIVTVYQELPQLSLSEQSLAVKPHFNTWSLVDANYDSTNVHITTEQEEEVNL
jgi:hypothetical protein